MQAEAHTLDEATRLVPLGEGWWTGAAHPAYANMAGPFGGVTAAALLNAVLLDPRRAVEPIALTVNFCGPIADGEFEIETKLQRGGRTTQHWSMELRQNGAGHDHGERGLRRAQARLVALPGPGADSAATRGRARDEQARAAEMDAPLLVPLRRGRP